MLRLLKNGIVWFLAIFTIKPKPLTAEEKSAWFEQKGIFEYTDDGFAIEIKGKYNQHRWDDIETAIGYKVDLLTTDEICMQIHFSETVVTITESTAGWPKFQKNLHTRIPAIGENWEMVIEMPRFATNLTLLYDKKRRSLNEIFPTNDN